MSLRKSSRLAKKTFVEEKPEMQVEDDDDAPEEIGLSMGRESAMRQIEDEKQVERSAKASKRELAAKRQQKGQKVSEKADVDEAEDKQEVPEAPSSASHGDLLPPSILAAIEERKRAHNRAQEQHSIIREALKPKTKMDKAGKGKASRIGLHGVKKGPVQVQILSLQARVAAASQKGNFKTQQMMREGLKRGLEMLRPVAALRQGPAARFVSGHIHKKN